MASREAAGFACVEGVLGLADGAVRMLPGGWRVKREAALLRLLPDEVEEVVPQEALITVTGEVHWGRYTISASFGGPVERSRQGTGVWPASCTLSARLLAGKALSVRGRKPGDRMAPYGMAGTRKLQDIFTDAKVPEAERDSYPVIVCGDEIVWLPGYRIAAPYAVHDGDECLRLTVGRFDSRSRSLKPDP
jgi:tRNA(Ile)-lysidine synthetase-like protein